MIKKKYNKLKLRKLSQTLACLLPGVLLLLVGYIDNATVGFIILTLAVMFNGFCYSGYSTIFVEICPRYSGALYAVSNTIATIPGFVAPTLTGMIVDKNSTAS